MTGLATTMRWENGSATHSFPTRSAGVEVKRPIAERVADTYGWPLNKVRDKETSFGRKASFIDEMKVK